MPYIIKTITNYINILENKYINIHSEILQL